MLALLVSLSLGTLLSPCTWGQQREEKSVFGEKMQRRSVPVDSSFHRQFYLSTMGSYHRWLDQGMSSGPLAGLAAGMWFTPLHGARIEVNAGYFFDNETRRRVKILPDIRASYLFNLSAFMNGYQPHGRGTLYTLLGAGYAWRMSAPSTGGKSSWNMQLGMGYSVRVLKRVDLFVEPVFELNGNRFMLQNDDNWRGYSSGFRGTVGLNYRLDSRSNLPAWPEHDWFITLSGGASWQVSQVPRGGFHIQFGVGEYLSPVASVRLSGSWMRNFKKDEPENRSEYIALHLDGIWDLLAIGQQERRPWGLSLMAGPEVGAITAKEPFLFGGVGVLHGQNFYVGMSAGMQLRARLHRRWDAFFESRASVIPYSALNQEKEPYNTADVALSANLGLQYNIRRHDERVAAWERVKYRTRNNWEQFKQRSQNNWQALYPKLHLFVGLEGSYFRPLDRNFTNGPFASLSLGGWFNGMNGLMLNAGLGYFQDLKYGNAYVKTSEFSGAYLFNISHFLHREEALRTSDLSLMAGAGYILPIREMWNGSVVFRAGLDWRMHVLNRTHLVVRPEIDYLKLPSGQWGPALRGSMGLAYNMGGHSNANFPDAGKEWYMAVSGGYLGQLARLDGQSAGGASFGLAVGRHFTPSLDWRLSLSYHSKLQYASVNMDALYNLFGKNMEDSRWSLSLLGGPEMGYLRQKSSKYRIPVYLGASAGMQVKYRFDQGLALFLEPRYSYIPELAHTYSASLGLEYAFARERYHQEGPMSSRPKDKEKGYPFVQVGGTVFAPFGPGYANGPIASLAGGYWFNGLHGVMLDTGVGFFRDNLYSKGADGRVYGPQHMAAGELRASYLYRFHPRVSLMAGAGWLVPEIKQFEYGSFTAHAGLDFRIPIVPPVDLVLQPQIEVFRDPHGLFDGNPKAGLGGAFRGSFGLAYNITKNPPAALWSPGHDWFVTVMAGLQNESGIYTQPEGVDFSLHEYRMAVAVGKKLSSALSVRASASSSEIYPREYTFLHNLRYTSVNLELLYDLLAREDGSGRFSLSLLAGPEGGFYNKNESAEGHERPLRVPFHIGNRSPRNVGFYLGASVGVQAGVRLYNGLFFIVEPRYSMVPYVSIYSATERRNMYSHLWNVNMGFQYFFRNFASQ